MKIQTFGSPVLIFGAALASPCFGQVEQLEEVVITGSRLGTVSGFNTPTPVTVLQAEELEVFAPNNIADALQELPVLAGSLQNTTGGTNSGNSGTVGQSILDLRGIGENRTLVLLDGQRMGVTNVQNSVDANIIPQTLVKRVDIVTGGASASYGSDAVAGVVNFILDTRFEGFKTEVTAGISDKRDTENYHVTASFGHRLGEATRMIGSVEWFDQSGVGTKSSGREWRDNPHAAFASGTQTIVVPNARYSDASDAGVVRSVSGCSTAACSNLQWNQFINGQIVPFNRGIVPTATSRFSNGGDGSNPITGFIPEVTRKAVFMHLEHDFSPGLTLWGQGSFNDSDTLLDSAIVVPINTDNYTIYEGNPYLPAAVAAIFAADAGAPGAAGSESFGFSRAFYNGLDHVMLKGGTETLRIALGAKGTFGNNWSWDATGSRQDSHQDLDLHNVIVRNLFAAADVVTHPVTNQPVCRSQWYNAAGTFVPAGTGFDPGCVPMDLFSNQEASRAANNYVMGDNTAAIDIVQDALDANLRGNLGDNFNLGAGPISFALGASHRRVEAERKVDARSSGFISATNLRGMPTRFNNRIGEYWYYNPQPLKGEVKVTEGYAEIGVPLLANKPAVQALDLNLAGRSTDYSQSGVSNTWKAGLNWTVNDSVRLRGTLSSDIRAPSLLELFDPGSVVIGRSSFPSTTNAQFQSLGSNVARGNPDLSPEEAETTTFGIVLKPAFVPGLQISVDYYHIDISNAISAIGAQQVVDLCASGDILYCPRIVVNGMPLVNSTAGVRASDVVDVYTSGVNIRKENYEGIDFEIAYSANLGPGTFTTRLLGYQLRDYDNGNIAVACTAGLVGSISGSGGCGVHPEWIAQANFGYSWNNFGVNWRQRYIDSGKVNPAWTEGVQININNVPSVTYTDLNFGYDIENLFGGKGKVFLNVTNAFDETPPVATAGGTTFATTTANGLYDVIGRRYLMGIQASF